MKACFLLNLKKTDTAVDAGRCSKNWKKKIYKIVKSDITLDTVLLVRNEKSGYKIITRNFPQMSIPKQNEKILWNLQKKRSNWRQNRKLKLIYKHRLNQLLMLYW